MALFEIDVVKVEKAKAMRRYNRRRTVKWIVELCAALFVLSLSPAWLPGAAETACEFFRRFIAVFDCTFYVFILIMAIIFILYAFSGENGARTDIYDDFLRYKKPSSKLAAGNELPVQPETYSSPAETFHDKHIVFWDNANSPAHDDGTVSSITERTASPFPLDRVAAVTEKALREKRYRRARSEKLELRILETTRRELRQTETGICRELVRSGEEPARRSSTYPPEELSIEEFNRMVEAYIADKKEAQREELKEERRKESSLAPTAQN
ncbi:chromatin assembly factor 1 subunit A-like [Juglans microcarpa x Juglans regia]|uniref:chromatin assembly factor 1 subunit A-like n=1 Tax=Juglans microcarpa x Juglans regia TaxID=2249226 RepID=UPI001B7D9C94|nr:chromatin assembly factor 1 subunit A-like [Juglans microcarpa x Juglans regia]